VFLPYLAIVMMKKVSLRDAAMDEETGRTCVTEVEWSMNWKAAVTNLTAATNLKHLYPDAAKPIVTSEGTCNVGALLFDPKEGIPWPVASRRAYSHQQNLLRGGRIWVGSAGCVGSALHKLRATDSLTLSVRAAKRMAQDGIQDLGRLSCTVCDCDMQAERRGLFRRQQSPARDWPTRADPGLLGIDIVAW